MRPFYAAVWHVSFTFLSSSLTAERPLREKTGRCSPRGAPRTLPVGRMGDPGPERVSAPRVLVALWPGPLGHVGLTGPQLSVGTESQIGSCVSRALGCSPACMSTCQMWATDQQHGCLEGPESRPQRHLGAISPSPL